MDSRLAKAHAIAALADRLREDFLAVHAGMQVALLPNAGDLLPDDGPGWRVPTIRVSPDGLGTTYHWRHYLQRLAEPEVRDRVDRDISGGGLIRLGDALDAEGYFDRAPILEFVRHLRNAIAHGNRFEITPPERLNKHPAHTGNAPERTDKRTWEITADLHGKPCLFDFIDADGVLTIYYFVATYLREDYRPASAQAGGA
jgi:hypothetical protein